MNVLLNGIEINKETLTVNTGLNYGRFYLKETKEYEIQLADFNVVALIEKEYTRVRDEIKIDDEIYQDSSDFINTNYCSLQELFKYESDFEKIMKTYLDITLYNKLFPDSPKNQFVINSTDSINIHNNMIIFKGKVFAI